MRSLMDNKFIDRIDELDWKVLQELSEGKKTVFEFGTFIGGSAMAMLPQIKEAGGHLWCIDHFRDNVSQPPELHIHPYEVVARLLVRVEPYHDTITVIVGDVTEALNFPKGMADLVFIDAAHSYSMVKRDIGIALHLCKQGGTICGHDYVQHYEDCDQNLMEKYADTESGYFRGVTYGVIRAVNEVFGKPQNEGAIWWVNTESSHY